MSLTIKLDAAALAALFSAPEPKLELQRAVVAEFCRQLWPNYLNDDARKQLTSLLEAAKPELLALSRDEKQLGELVTQRIRLMKENLRGQVKLGQASEEMIREVDSRVDRIIRDRIEERAGSMQELVDKAADRVVQRIEANMERWVNDAVNSRITRGVEERIEKMRSAL